MDFPKELRRLRLEKNILQKDLGNLVGVEAKQISRLETGYCEPNLDMLVRLANAFGCSIDYLLGRETEDGVIKIISQSEKSEIQALFDKLDRFEKERVLGYVRALVAMKDTGAGNQAN